MATADEVIASVDATLDSWRSAFEPSRAKNADRADGGDADAASPPSPITEAKPLPPWKDRDAYQRRLGTFAPDTYFAKPLELSPLVCATFGWENTGKDIIKCCHPKCGSTICILFHPGLNEDSHRQLCRKYLDMLTSSHTPGCPFRPFARRWSKAMHQCSSRSVDHDKSERTEDTTKENTPEYLMNKVSEGLGDAKPDFYVPPYFLSLSDEFLCFEDCSGDGSITTNRVKEGALQIRDELHSILGGSEVDVTIPDAVEKYCHEAIPGADVGSLLCQKDEKMKVPYLLSVFGWSPSNELAGEKAGAVVKCSICQARSRLTELQSPDGETASRKRRRVDLEGGASIKLVASHRIYCPFVSGFSRGDIPGWKVVVSNLLKATAS